MNPLARKQFDLNQTTRTDWAVFAGHRRRVTDLLTESASGSDRLCILGAGNCNDIDLAGLARAHEEVVLVDLDREALVNGIASQPIDTANRVKCLNDIDVSGCLSRTATWSMETRLDEADFVALSAGANVRQWPTDAHFDVVASTCLLSQLIGSLDHSLTSRHPQFIQAVQAIRTGHFRTIASLLGSGGRTVLINDIVSSVTCPELLARPASLIHDSRAIRIGDPAQWLISIVSGKPAATDPRHDVGADVYRLVANALTTGNFFTGLNPVVVHKFLRSDPEIAPLFDKVTFIPPWVWQCGQRSYAVYAIEATRAMAPRLSAITSIITLSGSRTD